MALTANRELNRFVDQELRSFGVAAAEKIFKGSLVGFQRSTGFVRKLVSGDVFAGVAYEESDNTGGAAGAIAIRLYTQGDFVLPVNNAAQGWAGAPLYAVDDEKASIVFGGGKSRCGILLEATSASEGVVRITPAVAAQTEHVVSVQLQSLTTAATVNALFITQRAVKIVGIDVSFNTKPDAGSLNIGTDAADPDDLVDAFDLTTLTNDQPTSLTLVTRDVAVGFRIWAKVGQASSTAGVGGMLTVRYIELP